MSIRMRAVQEWAAVKPLRFYVGDQATFDEQATWLKENRIDFNRFKRGNYSGIRITNRLGAAMYKMRWQ